MVRKLTQNEFEDRAKQRNQIVTVIGQYNGDKHKVECKCNFCGASLWMQPSNIYAGKGCYKCSKQRVADSQRKTTEQFRAEIKQRQPQITVVGEYTGANQKIQCLCNIHQCTFESTPTHLLGGQTGCSFCIAEKFRTMNADTDEHFRSTLADVNPMVEVLSGYTNRYTNVHVRCRACGFEWDATPSALLIAHGCRKCYHSVGEYMILEWLDANGVKYECQKKYPQELRGLHNRSPLAYDFYLPDYDTLIEYQGEFHDGTAWKGIIDRQQTMRQQENDAKKREFAKQKKLNLIEIWYYQRDQIPNILSGLVN